MPEKVKEHLEQWLALNRDFLWKVMNHKEKVDAVFRDPSIGMDNLLKVCDEVETHLDELKDMLKKLYLLLYESQDKIKEAKNKQHAENKFEEDIKKKKEAAEKVDQEEVELRKKMERERIETAAKRKTEAASQKQPPAPEHAEEKPKSPPQPEKKAESEPAKVPLASHATLEVASADEPPEARVDSDGKEEEQEKIPLPDIKIPEKIGGLIAFLGLAEWFASQSPDKQKESVGIMISDGKMTPFDVIERDIQTLKTQFAPYCWKTANKLMRNGYDELATGLLIKGLTVVTKKRDKEMLHIMYAKYFYRQRKHLNNAYDACINHCEKAIKSYMQDKEDRPKPVAPFKLLTMIYEEKNDLNRIIQVCDRAIQLYQGSADESKVLGFLRIKDILEKKEKQIKEQQANPKS